MPCRRWSPEFRSRPKAARRSPGLTNCSSIFLRSRFFSLVRWSTRFACRGRASPWRGSAKDNTIFPTSSKSGWRRRSRRRHRVSRSTTSRSSAARQFSTTSRWARCIPSATSTCRFLSFRACLTRPSAWSSRVSQRWSMARLSRSRAGARRFSRAISKASSTSTSIASIWPDFSRIFPVRYPSA